MIRHDRRHFVRKIYRMEKLFAFFADKNPDHSAVTSSLYLLKQKTTPESMLYKGRSFLHI